METTTGARLTLTLPGHTVLNQRKRARGFRESTLANSTTNINPLYLDQAWNVCRVFAEFSPMAQNPLD